MIANDADHNRKGNETMAKTKSTTDATEATETEPAEEVFSAKALATELNVDPKAFRRWFRSNYTARAGKGKRYAFTAETKTQVLDAYRAHAAKATEVTPADADA